MPSGTSLFTWISCRACLRKTSKIWSVIWSPTTSPLVLRYHHHLLGSLSGAIGPLAFIGRRKLGRPLRNSWRSHSQPLPGCWATSCSISGSIPFPFRLPLSQGPICLLGLGAGLRWLGKDGEASMGREGSFNLLIYLNKNIRWTFYLFILNLIALCTSRLLLFKFLQLICFTFGNNTQLLVSKAMLHVLRLNFENFGHTTKNKIIPLLKLLAHLTIGTFPQFRMLRFRDPSLESNVQIQRVTQ